MTITGSAIAKPGTFLAPITSLAIVLKAIAEEKGGFVEAAAEPEAAPAE